MKTGIQLIGIKVCPYVERIRLTFGYKNLQYSYKVISPLEQKSEEFTKISPYNRVPVIVLPDNTSVYESAAIFQYLDEQYPEKKLLDGTPFEKAHQRIWTHFCNTKLSTSLYQYMFEHKSKEEFEADLKFLENYLKTSSGEFFFNDK